MIRVPEPALVRAPVPLLIGALMVRALALVLPATMTTISEFAPPRVNAEELPALMLAAPVELSNRTPAGWPAVPTVSTPPRVRLAPPVNLSALMVSAAGVVTLAPS